MSIRGKPPRAMWERLFRLSAERAAPLQAQIRQMLAAAVAERALLPADPVPSSRELSEVLGVARNTVVLAYQQLVDEGLLVSRERSGYFVSPELAAGWVAAAPRPAAGDGGPDWAARLRHDLAGQRNITKPPDWQRYPYPFLYGQFDPALFPLAEWRECCRLALSVADVRDWAPDRVDEDDPLLIEQLRTRILPRRGVWAAPDEILVTIGAQHALFILAELLLTTASTVGVEDPGYPDARNIFALKAGRLVGLSIDGEGVVPDGALAGCDYVYVTPSHQCPTTVTMPLERRQALLRLAAERDIVVIEDDYEVESNFARPPLAALKSLDAGGRVLYVGSLSKTLAPGLRLGYLVAPAPLIAAARALRRLMVRQPPANNQRAVALFLSLGHHDALLQRMRHVMAARAEILARAIARHLSGFVCRGGLGGSSYWLAGPHGLDATALAGRAQAAGILIEPGAVFFMDGQHANHLRLGFSSIPQERIEPGIARLAALAADLVPAPRRRAGWRQG
jgi:GntR family transcriptional regulator/MocR family aminotransferase